MTIQNIDDLVEKVIGKLEGEVPIRDFLKEMGLDIDRLNAGDLAQIKHSLSLRRDDVHEFKPLDSQIEVYNFCCKQFRHMVHDGSIIGEVDEFFIFGKPDTVNDGDGFTEDITARHKIDFCPFCGLKRKKRYLKIDMQ